jgi:hypothetical protein
MKPYPTPAIMDQAVKLYGCNCDACCNMTPLARRREATIRARLTKRALDLAKRAAQKKLSKSESILVKAGYTVLPPSQ